jgi:two-component system KDP operon response regulator KdpE
VLQWSLFAPATTRSPVGSVLRVRLQAHAGLSFTALARVERVHERESGGRPPGMELRLLEVRRASMATAAASVALGPPSLRPSAMPGPVRVLIVEDDAAMRARAVRVLREGGYEVVEAENGAQAIGLAIKDVSLILTDVNMPVMDGWQLLRMVKARDELSHVPVVFLTSLTSDTQRFRGYALGVDDYIDKPYSSTALLRRVRRALARSLEPDEERAALRGDLGRVGLPNLLALIELERRTGRLELRSDDVTGRVLLNAGRVVHLAIDHPLAPEEPLDLFYAMLGWKEGEFELFHEAVELQSDVGVSISHMLMELARIEDEANASAGD